MVGGVVVWLVVWWVVCGMVGGVVFQWSVEIWIRFDFQKWQLKQRTDHCGLVI